MKNFRTWFIAPLFLMIFLLSMGGGVHAALASTYATNFESFTLGDINTQDGWTSGHGSSFCPVYDVDAVTNTFGYSSFGNTSLRISNAITCGSFNDQTFSQSLSDEAGETSAPTSTFSGGTRQPYFQAQWDFASAIPGSAQPGLSVVASPNRGDTMRMSWVQMLDTDDSQTGLTLNFEDYQHSILNFVTTPIATHLDRTVPHTVKITMQFIDGAGNDIVKVYLDGVLVHTGTSWEDYYRDSAGGFPFAVDSIMFREAGTAVPATLGNGFLIDNFSSFSGPVPATGPSAPTALHIVSNNASTTLAKSGDIVTVTATVDASSTVAGTIGGKPATSATVASTTATLTRILDGTETEGQGLDFTLVSRDSLGNSVATSTKAAITDGSSVETDFTPPSAPTSAPVAGTYTGVQSVTLSSVGSTSIWYSAGGSVPSCSVGTLYSTPIAISSTQTINVVGCDAAGNASASAGFLYTINFPVSGGGGSRGFVSSAAAPAASPVIITPIGVVPPVPIVSTPGTSQSINVPSIAPALASATKLIIGNLPFKSRGLQVRTIQQLLISENKGLAAQALAKAGATSYFGILTRAALAEFQAAVGITPALGNFGPITRAYIAAHY